MITDAWYWSSSICSDDTVWGYIIDFKTANLNGGRRASANYHARCVRDWVDPE